MVTTFCIVNIPVIGRDLQLPYVAASVALDGAALSIFGAVQECKPDDVRMGMRVEAVWKPDGERTGLVRRHALLPAHRRARRAAESYINRSENFTTRGAETRRACVSASPRSAVKRIRDVQLRNVAVVGFAQAPIVAHDAHRMAPEMLYPQVRRGAGAVRRRARRHRLPDRRLGRLHRRPAVRLRRRARRHGHLAAAAGLAPGDGRRLRRLLRLGPHAGRRVRHRAWWSATARSRRASPSASSTCSSTPTTWRRSASAR